MKFYYELFMLFFKIGMFVIGGGYAMIPFIKKAVVEDKKWLTEEEFLDALAVSQSAPGILAVNVSVYVGKRLRGIKGILAASLGAVLPSFLIILIIAIFFQNFQDNKYVIKAFKGIKPAVIALVLTPALTLAKKAGINYKNALLPILIALLISLLNISPIIFIILGIVGGNLYYKGAQK
ncbi:MAG: chromate transporter [Cetobacterium sp.]